MKRQKGFVHFLVLIVAVLLMVTLGVVYFGNKVNTNRPQQNSFSLTQNTGNWKLYKDQNHQFLFNYPNSMPDISQKEPSRGYYEETLTAVSETTENVNGYPNSTARIEIKGPFKNSKGTQMESYLRNQGEFLPQEGVSQGQASIIERQPITIDSKPAILIKESMGTSNYPLSYILYFQTDLGIYSLNLFSSGEGNLTLEDFESVIASIKLMASDITASQTSWYSIPSKKCNMSFAAPNDPSVEVKGLTENEVLRIFDWNATFSLVKNNHLVSVEVLCSSNDKSFTSDSHIARIEQIVAGNSQSQNRRIPSKILSKTKSSSWGREVYVLTYEAGDFQDFYAGDNYVFATKTNTYSVRIVNELSDPETSEVIQQVFDRLEFN